MVEVRRKTALQRHAAQAVVLSRGSAGFSFELSAWFCVGAWVRVVGAWTARGRVRDCPSACCSTDTPVDATTAYGRWSRGDARPLYNATRRKPLVRVAVRRDSVSNFQRGSAWARGFAWSARGRRVVRFGIVLRLAALLTHPLTLPRRTADGRGATQDRSTTPRGASRWSESRFGGIQFRTFSVVLRGRVGSRGRRVDGAWSGSGLSFGLLLY